MQSKGIHKYGMGSIFAILTLTIYLFHGLLSPVRIYQFSSSGSNFIISLHALVFSCLCVERFLYLDLLSVFLLFVRVCFPVSDYGAVLLRGKITFLEAEVSA